MNYRSIAERSDFLLKEKGSKFIAIAFPCSSQKSFKEQMISIQVEYSKATHYCFAYRFLGPPISTRANDDGEPSNSAGSPILGQIQSFELLDVAVVVIRYYGGTKLGVSGLIKAYKGSAKFALENARIIDKEPTSNYHITGDYLLVSQLLAFLKKKEIKIIAQNMTQLAEIEIEVPISKVEIILSKVAEFKIQVKRV